MKYDVTIDRHKYVGGSDVPAIMGLSPFKTRWELVLEKAGLSESEFLGNEYTEYGNVMEPKIRDYINGLYDLNYEPDQKILGRLRANTDGYDPKNEMILEVKTTSQTHIGLQGYRHYLVQILFYMHIYGAYVGHLAVYDRPDDFSEEFDPERLQIFTIKFPEHITQWEKCEQAIDLFLDDVDWIREHPLAEESDLPSQTMALTIAEQAVTVRNKIESLKALEAEYKDFLDKMYAIMDEKNIKSVKTLDGTRFTRVLPTDPKVVREFDVISFKDKYPELYEAFLVDRQKSGRAGYVRVTTPKEKE